MFNYFRLKWPTYIMLLVASTCLCGVNVFSAQQDLPIRKGIVPRPTPPRSSRRISRLEKMPAPIVKPTVESEADTTEITVYKKLTEKSPDDSSNWASFAFVYYKAHRYEEAVAPYRRAIELKATDSWCYQLGHALFSLKRYTEAAEAFSQALLLNPRFNAARYELALSYFKTGDRKSALAQAEILASFNNQLADALRADLKSGRIR